MCESLKLDIGRDGSMRKVTTYLDQLLNRVEELTSARGERKAMALDLGVPPQKLNDWLSRRFKPEGEATLRLLRWVTLQELKRDGKMESVLNILLGTSPQTKSGRRKSTKAE